MSMTQPYVLMVYAYLERSTFGAFLFVPETRAMDDEELFQGPKSLTTLLTTHSIDELHAIIQRQNRLREERRITNPDLF